jgi:hypothetical protein
MACRRTGPSCRKQLITMMGQDSRATRLEAQRDGRRHGGSLFQRTGRGVVLTAWQYIKNRLALKRADLTLYSTRHLMAQWLDNEAIAQRTRDRILGHVSDDVRGRYGSKGVLDPKIAATIEALEPDVLKKMREILLGAKKRADAGELDVIKTYRVSRTGPSDS